MNVSGKVNAESLQDSMWKAEQVKLLFSYLPMTVFSHFVIVLLMLGVMSFDISVTMASVWLGLMSLLLTWRGALYWLYQRESEKKSAAYWLLQFRLTIFLTGLLWGFVALEMFPVQNISHQAFLAFVLAGMCAAACTALSADRVSVFAFIFPTLLALAFSFVRMDSEMSLVMGVMVVLFIVILAVTAVRMQRNLYANSYLRSETLIQQQGMQQSEERFSFMLETCPTAALIARNGGHEVIFFNQRYAALINIAPDLMADMDPQSFYAHQSDYEDICFRLDKGEKIYERLIELNIPGAGTKWALASYLTLSYQGQPAVLSWFHDITEQFRIERMKTDFISTVSYELRTPLTAINGVLGMLVGGVMGDMPAPIRDMVTVASNNSQKLSSLINDLLDMEKVSSSMLHVDMQTQPAKPLIAQSVEANRGDGIARRVTISLQDKLPDVIIRVDKQRMMQVLSTLLSNAIKYSPDGGNIEVTTCIQNNALRLTVTDHGPCVTAAFHTRISAEIAQTDSTDTCQRAGMGLGLAITRELMQHMGGTIGFESEEGQGASFYVSLPLVPASG